VALVLAELVGPQGSVVGIDTNAEILEVAKTRVDAAGWRNVSFRSCDLADLGRGEFDGVIGRWVLMYVADPVHTVREAAERVGPGGLVAFQEGVFNDLPRPVPPGPVHEQVLRWMTPPSGAPGPDVEMGLKLFQTFLDAGLSAPQLRSDTPVGGGPRWPGYAYVVSTLRSLLPFLEQVGAVTAREVDIDTLEERLRAEVVDQRGVQRLPPLLGAWTRT
jgi:SAM-dependent methyltransferase